MGKQKYRITHLNNVRKEYTYNDQRCIWAFKTGLYLLINSISFVSRSCSVASHFEFVKRDYGKTCIFIHSTVSYMFANQSALVFWLSNLLSMDSHSVFEGVSHLSDIIFGKVYNLTQSVHLKKNSNVALMLTIQ